MKIAAECVQIVCGKNLFCLHSLGNDKTCEGLPILNNKFE